jgi:outer membrane protein assembly factor BamB
MSPLHGPTNRSFLRAGSLLAMCVLAKGVLAKTPSLRNQVIGDGCGPVSTDIWNMSSAFQYTSPVTGPNGLLYSVTITGTGIFAFDSSLGMQAWHVSAPAPILAPPFVDASGAVYVTTGNTLLVLNGSTGAIDWQASVTNDLLTASAVVGVDGRVYVVGAESGGVYAFNATTGAPLWTYGAGAAISSSVAVSADGGMVYVSAGNELIALYSSNGLWAWTYAAQSVNTPVVGPAGVVYVASIDPAMAAVNGTTGERIWMTIIQAQPLLAPASIGADGTVYLGTITGIYSFNGATGKILWTYSTVGSVLSSPVVGVDGSIAFATPNTLFALYAPTGYDYWNYASPALQTHSFSGPTAGPNGILYVGATGFITVVNPNCPPMPGPESGQPGGLLSTGAAAAVGTGVCVMVVGVLVGVWLVRRRGIKQGYFRRDPMNRERLLQLQTSLNGTPQHD